MDAKQRIQKELDRLGLKAGQEFKIGGEVSYYVSYHGIVTRRLDDKPTPFYSLLTLNKKDITWRETQPDWSEDLLGWCKYVEDCWIAKDYTEHDDIKGIFIFGEKPVHEEDGDYWNVSLGLMGVKLGHISVKDCIISEIDKHLQTGKNGTVIQIIDSKPYLRRVIDGIIQEICDNEE